MKKDLFIGKLLDVPESKLWYSNLNWEQKIKLGVRLPQFKNAASDAIVEQMHWHQVYLADEHDEVIIKEAPNPDYLAYLERQGVRLPQLFIGNPYEHPDKFRDRPVIPYLLDASNFDFFRENHSTVIGPPPTLALDLNNKIFTRMLCESHSIPVSDGVICHHYEQLAPQFHALQERTQASRFVLKTAYGSSGKNLFHIRDSKDFEFINAYLSRQREKADFMVSIERWHEVDYNLNAQLLLWNGTCRILAITSQEINDVGVYKGSDLNPAVPEQIMEAYKSELEQLGRILLEQGYQGFAGVDSIIDKQGRLIPVIEINARLTMVTYMLAIRDQLISDGFAYIAIRFYDLKSPERIPFSSLEQQFEELDLAGQRGALIYGFHEVLDPKQQIYVYRVFVLCWAREKQQLLNLIEYMQGMMDSKKLVEKR
ncbi:ATP-grasp domain-containing protein [Paenibacillus aceti]|uniref:Phosphoribosylglycinamide formyltransferase 2 n=1 Tax=Paenibacillus aceti TaxID=1820010 RepID=A0ABQ1VRE2_9BACL|nr:ATP-grasp domain-containing protein [Paenibacillus aceti]GGF90652.1 phosphoribosylglycinamide formyltransferase 2 [Paenibacillus aceti]